MSVIDNIVSSIANSLGQQASGQVADANASASGADTGFKALLAIGSEDSAPVEDKGVQRDASSGKDERRRDKDRQNDTPAAAVAGVPSPIIDQAPKAPKGDSSKGDNAKAASVSGEEKPASYDKPAAPAEKAAQAPAADKAQASKNVPATNTKAGADSENAEPLSEDDIRAALSDQFGNIGSILESLIQLLSGGAVVSAADASLPQVVADELGLVQGTNGVEANDGTVLSTSGDVDALKQIALLKDIVSIVRQLQQALLAATANGEGSVVVAQQQTTTITVTRVEASVAQFAVPADVSELMDNLSSQLAKLLPQLPEGYALKDQLGANVDVSQIALIKAELKQSISTVRVQLQQLSVANEHSYANALDRFQALLASDDQNETQGDALLKQMLAMMAKGVSGKEDAATITQAVANNAGAPNGDKQQGAANNTLLAGAAPIIVEATANNANSNSSGNQQGGQQNMPTIPGVPSISAGQTSGASAGDSAFTRALSLTGQKPIPEQIAVQVKTAAADGSSKITIQLDPEDLGKLDIKLHVKADGKTGIVITADSGNTLNLLQRDSQNLLRALHDAGLQTDSGSLSFNLRGDQQGQQGNSHMAGNYQKAQPGEDEEVLIQTVSRQYTVNLNDGLDITI